jgi:hypothetical protein
MGFALGIGVLLDAFVVGEDEGAEDGDHGKGSRGDDLRSVPEPADHGFDGRLAVGVLLTHT